MPKNNDKIILKIRSRYTVQGIGLVSSGRLFVLVLVSGLCTREDAFLSALGGIGIGFYYISAWG